MYESTGQQAQGAPSYPPPSPDTPRSAHLLAQVNGNIETLSNMIDALAGRVIGPREAANSGGARGIPATYSALAESLVTRTDELIQRMQMIASEI